MINKLSHSVYASELRVCKIDVTFKLSRMFKDKCVQGGRTISET